MRFHKMHGLGNDFIIVDGRDQAIDLTKLLSLTDRRTGIGCDQLIVLENAADADVSMLIYNADGSQSGMCGNAARCVAWLESRRLGRDDVRLRIGDRVTRTRRLNNREMMVDMGQPGLEWAQIPLSSEQDTLSVKGLPDDLPQGTAVSMGNPHIVFFVGDVAIVDLDLKGPLLERHPLFPERTNVHFAQSIDRNILKAVVWERGVGRTQACGSGACAIAVAAIRRDVAVSPVTVRYPGGDIEIEWIPGGSVAMTGPVAYVCDGVFA